MSYRNKIGQTVCVGDVIAHTTASHNASISVGLVTGFTEHDSPYRTTPEVWVQVTWVNHTRGWGDNTRTHFIRTHVHLATVAVVDPLSLDPQLVENLITAQREGCNA